MSQPAAEPVHLDLDLLTRAYLENLHVSLRGFQAAQEHAFLSTWVPHDNPTDSLLEILQLARDAGLGRLIIRFAAETLPRLDLGRITPVADFPPPVPGQMELEFSLTARLSETIAAPLSAAPASQQAVSSTRMQKEEAESQGLTGAPPAKSPGDTDLAIHPTYQRGLREVLERIRHEGTLTEQPGQVLVVAGGEQGRLFALVASRGHVVVRATHSGAATPVRKGLLECLCETLEGKPILEGADHGVIAVECRLRDPGLRPPIGGVILPACIDRAFQELEELARGLLSRYREDTVFVETANFYASPVSPAWARLTDGERFRAIQQCLNTGGADELELVTLIGQKRAVVRFRRDMAPTVKQQTLAQAEAHLRQTVEPTLHLVMETKQDVNILRRKEG